MHPGTDDIVVHIVEDENTGYLSGAHTDAGQPTTRRYLCHTPRYPHTLFLPEVRGPTAFAFLSSFKISVDPIAHADYGLAYPVTYRFTLPSGSSNLSVYRRYNPNGPWTFVAKKTSADFFNGVEAVRFDYAAHRAFVSVAFDAESDDIFLAFVDTYGVRIPAEFEKIAWYYDARAAAVVVTGDDESDWAYEQFLSAYQAFTAARIWFTSAINTGVLNDSGWADVQTYIDRRYVEPACPSAATAVAAPF